MTMTVYEMRTYTVQVGKMPEAIRLYSQFGYPALHKGGFDKKLVGYFISDTGTLHQLVHKPRHDLLYASASLSRLDMPGANPCLAAPVFSPTLDPMYYIV